MTALARAPQSHFPPGCLPGLREGGGGEDEEAASVRKLGWEQGRRQDCHKPALGPSQGGGGGRVLGGDMGLGANREPQKTNV